MENPAKSREEISKISEELKKKGKKVVTTSGIFDLMHYGHVDILKRSKALGDILIVGLNSDESTKKLKGPTRPIMSEEDRAAMMESIDCVDYVTIFNEDTPTEMLGAIKPDIHVKGTDRKMEELFEKDAVEKNGGKVVLLSLIEGRSTTDIINKIIENYNKK